jgi:hypothetical protein
MIAIFMHQYCFCKKFNSSWHFPYLFDNFHKNAKKAKTGAGSDARICSDLFQSPLIDGMEALRKQLDPLAIFKSFEKIGRQCSDPSTGSKVRPADQCDRICISADICGNGEEVRGFLIPADQKERERQCLVYRNIMPDLEYGSIGICPLPLKHECIADPSPQNIILDRCLALSLLEGVSHSVECIID